MQEQLISRNLSVEVKVDEQVVANDFQANTKHAPDNDLEFKQVVHRYAALGYNSKMFDNWALNILERTSLANVSSELKGYNKETEQFHYLITITFIVSNTESLEMRQAMNTFAKTVKDKITALGLEYQSF